MAHDKLFLEPDLAKQVCQYQINQIQHDPLYAYGGMEAQPFTISDDAIASLTQFTQGYLKRVLLQAQTVGQMANRKRMTTRHVQTVLSARGHDDPLFINCIADTFHSK
jgi:hypothetical protein